MTTETNTRTITLTGRAPVKIREDQWPVIATGDYQHWDNQYEFQANRKLKINFRVRRHADGRAVVYAVYDYDTVVKGEECEFHKVGQLLDGAADLAAAITCAADELIERVADEDMHRHIRDAANECIADLPAQELE
jgi:hypothetical protein